MKDESNSPLELYEKAYRLQYDESKIPEACRLYKAIMDEFPDSNECGYAVIQLEKIIAKTMSERIVVSSRLATILGVAALAVSILSLACVLIAGGFYAKTLNARLSSLSAVSHDLAMQEAARAKAAEEAIMRKAVAEERQTADTAQPVRSRIQAVPLRERTEPASAREGRSRSKKESAASQKSSRHGKANSPMSRQDSVSFF